MAASAAAPASSAPGSTCLQCSRSCSPEAPQGRVTP
jgi:hypothetical protein